MKCNRSIGITGESSNFRRSATSVYRSARLLFTVGIWNDRGYPVALGRVNLSRAPHCPAAFSFGNEVMETRLDLPFLRRTILLLPFFWLLSPCLAFAGFPSSVLSFYPLVTDRTLVRRNRITFAVSLTSYVYSACNVSTRKGLPKIHISKTFCTNYILHIFWIFPPNKSWTKFKRAKLETVSEDGEM